MAHISNTKSTTAEILDDHASTTDEERGSDTQSVCADGGITARGTQKVTGGKRPLSLFLEGVSIEDEDEIAEVSNKKARVVKDANGAEYHNLTARLYTIVRLNREFDIITDFFDEVISVFIEEELFPILSGRESASPEALAKAASRYVGCVCRFVRKLMFHLDDLDILMARKREKLAANYLENLTTGTVPDIKFAHKAEKYRFVTKQIETMKGRIPAIQDRLNRIKSLIT